jgi:hypothetical protein
MGGGKLRHMGMISTSGSWRRHWLFLWNKNAQKSREDSAKAPAAASADPVRKVPADHP